MIFVTIAIVLYIQYEKLNFWYFAVSAAVCLLAFEATFCRTGLIRVLCDVGTHYFGQTEQK